MQSSQKILIGVLVLAILGFVAYKTVFTSPAAPIASSDMASSTEEDAGQQILDAVAKLNTVNIDGTLFSSDGFTHLQDFSTQINPEQQGRPNPFADIGSGSYSSQQQAAVQTGTAASAGTKTSSSPAGSKASQGKSSEI